MMDVPGVVFSAILNLTRGYFECVNDNGGIGGRPVEYIIINDQGDGNASHAAAVKLWEDDQVLGFAGNTSFVDCTVNHEYYEQNGIYPIVAGASAECFNTPNIAAVNQGPFYSVASATWYALNEKDATKIVCLRANVPGAEFQCQGAKVLAELQGADFVEQAVDVPIADPASLALRSAQEAGTTGAVLPGFTEDQLLPFMQAVEQQGLIDQAIWYAGATGSTSTFLQGLSDEWNDVWFAQSEFAVPETAETPDMLLYRSIVEQYEPDEPFGNFGEMGFLAGRFMTEALLRVAQSGDEINKESVNEAVEGLVNIPTDVLCKPWYFADLPSHLPNNGSLFTTRSEGGVAVPLVDECFPNPLTDPIIAQAYLDEIALGIPQLPGTPTQAEIDEFLAGAG
jgi:branched-chain amino acid transport system substrate-binding protein